MRAVEDAAGAEPGDAVKDRRAGEPFAAETLEERHRERLVMPAVRFPDEDPRQELLAVQDPHDFSFRQSDCQAAVHHCASARPPAPAARHAATVRRMLAIPIAPAPPRRY